MSKYNNPTTHHESTIDYILELLGAEKKMFKRNLLKEVESRISRVDDGEIIDDATIKTWMDEVKYDVSFIPDAYLFKERKNGMLDIHIFEIVATHKLSRDKTIRYEMATASIEQFGHNVYIHYIDAQTRGVSVMDFDLASVRLDIKSGRKHLDYRNIVLEYMTVNDLPKYINRLD